MKGSYVRGDVVKVEPDSGSVFEAEEVDGMMAGAVLEDDAADDCDSWAFSDVQLNAAKLLFNFSSVSFDCIMAARV